MKTNNKKLTLVLILTLLFVWVMYIAYGNYTRTKTMFVPDCTDEFAIPKQNNPKRFVAIAGHFDGFTADEQFFVDSKLVPLYPNQEKAINKFLSSLYCGNELFPRLVSISPDFATGEAMLTQELIRQQTVFKGKPIYNLKKEDPPCKNTFTFEVENKMYFSIVNIDTAPDLNNIISQKLTITFPSEQNRLSNFCNQF